MPEVTCFLKLTLPCVFKPHQLPRLYLRTLAFGAGIVVSSATPPVFQEHSQMPLLSLLGCTRTVVRMALWSVTSQPGLSSDGLPGGQAEKVPQAMNRASVLCAARSRPASLL